MVPFYFQPTLGGSDINGNSWLPSYNDYRFRAPNAILLRESFEHSIWGPIGFAFSADQGKVALTRGNIDFNHLAHSFSAGLTVRAGGLPALSLSFAWAARRLRTPSPPSTRPCSEVRYVPPSSRFRPRVIASAKRPLEIGGTHR